LGCRKITDAQPEYAASDALSVMISRHLIACCAAKAAPNLLTPASVPLARIELDLMGWNKTDIFAHS
jgi:ribonuclease D